MIDGHCLAWYECWSEKEGAERAREGGRERERREKR